MHDAPIVVGIEDTAEAAEALRWAARESRRTEAPLVAVHAYGYDVPKASPAVATTQESEARSWATHWLRDVLSLDGTTPWRTHLVVVRETPGSALTRFSRDAAMLVLGGVADAAPDAAPDADGAEHVTAVCHHHALCPVVTMPAAVLPEDGKAPDDRPRRARVSA